MRRQPSVALSVLGVCILLIACGPSEAEQQAQQTAIAAKIFATQTAGAPTVTPTPVTPTATLRPSSTPTMTSTPTETPTPTTTPTPMPDAVVETGGLNVRGGPGSSYSIVGEVGPGDPLQVIGRSGSACSWLQVITPMELEGWVVGEAQYVTLYLPCAEIPLVEIRPETDLIDRYQGRTGHGELLVKNGTEGDGVVILTTLQDTPVMAAYIRSDESYRMTGIPDGTYRLFFSKGAKWDHDEKVFTEQVRRQRFDDTLDFSTSGTRYSIWEVTLYGVVGGTAGTANVPEGQFPELP